jgi:1-acyl-sn-glycerol-3-phosphate acyltransferase
MEPSAAYSRRFTRAVVRCLRPLARLWFRPRVEGWGNVPPSPVLIVGNHSGYGAAELLLLLSEWTRQFGFDRPPAALSHDLGFRWPLRWAVARLGGLHADRSVAVDALRRGVGVMALLSVVPNPTRIQIQFLPATDPGALLAQHGGERARAAEALRQQMERALKDMAAVRRTPWG